MASGIRKVRFERRSGVELVEMVTKIKNSGFRQVQEGLYRILGPSISIYGMRTS